MPADTKTLHASVVARFLILAAAFVSVVLPVQTAETATPTVLITGSNRGIGLAFARHYARAGWRVLATCRSPGEANELHELATDYPHVVVEKLDVANHQQIDQLAAKYHDTPLDLLLNNAGMLGDPGKQILGGLDYELLAQAMAVNAYGPLKMVEAFADHVAASEQKKIVTVSSGLGSMTILQTRPQNGNSLFYFYRISKAAVNMAMSALRVDLRERGIIVALVSPGMVGTRMLEQTGYRGSALKPQESVAGLVEIIEELSLDDDGTITNYAGKVIPW